MVLERNSEHPIAKAILRYVNDQVQLTQRVDQIQVSDFKSESGRGVSGISGGRLFEVRGDFETPWLMQQRELGRVGVAVLVDGLYQGGISIRDPPRRDAKKTVEMLHWRGIEVVMCTGDAALTARAIAREVGIDENNVYAKCTPLEKQRVIADKKVSDKFIAMVGDGINDGPALATASVGVAMGGGVRIASDSADVVLVRAELVNFVLLIDLSKATLKCIKRNLWWAFGFNVVMIPWAAGAFGFLGLAKIPPSVAGVAMAGSSLLVVMSSLMLGRFRVSAIE